VAALRSALLGAIGQDDVQSLGRQLVARAKEGDLAAIRLVFAYSIGRPVETVDPDQLDQQEIELSRRGVMSQEDLQQLFATLGSDMALKFIRSAKPEVEKAIVEQMREAVLGQG
jgi:hypothetical protein